MGYHSGQGSVFTWGTTSYQLVSVRVTADAGSVIDITSMSSEVVEDHEDKTRKSIVPDWDTSVSSRYGNEVSVEFLAGDEITATNYFDCIGSKRTLTFKVPKPDKTTEFGFSIAKTAILTQMELTAAVGDYVKGSATFKITGR